MTLDLSQMLDRIRARQWVLADIDWDTPGAERITEQQFEPLQRFMTNLVWIEQIGARGFAGLARQATDPTLAEIYRYFHAEEQRHANAELALMRRWGMVADGRVPEPNINVRLAMDWLDANADDLPLEVLGTVIPMLEVALDGALVKFLLDEVHDPLCHEVFDKINNDESRHLAVDFHVLEVLGAEHVPRSRLRARLEALRPSMLIGGLVSLPLFARIGRSVEAMGLDRQRLLRSLSRFNAAGDRSPVVWRNPAYRALATHTKAVVEQGPGSEWLADVMMTLSDHYPRALLRPIPAWIDELTWEPLA